MITIDRCVLSSYIAYTSFLYLYFFSVVCRRVGIDTYSVLS